MLLTNLKAILAKTVVLAAVTVAVALGSSLIAASPALAQHKMNANDLELPTNDMEVVKMGRGMYAQRCSFCHGGDGHGGKGPCLTCGKFSYSGNTNGELYAVIAAGIPQNRGGTMGAFGTTMSQEQILSVLTFLRWEEARRIKDGEVPDPYNQKGNELPVFPNVN
jgi:mono/diheme cytochrome c family protein